MRRPPLATLGLLGALALPGGSAAGAVAPSARVLVLDHGRVHTRVDRFAAPSAGGPEPSPLPPPPLHSSPEPASTAASGRTLASELRRLHGAGALDDATYGSDLAVYDAARRSVKRLSGTRRAELSAVLSNAEAIAGRGALTSTRVPELIETLRRNRDWWTSGPLLASGARVGFPGSRLVWEYYPGQGVEIQWLATFGKANGYFLSGDRTGLRSLLDEAIGLAATRAGGPAWEYEFVFDGGRPPWVSALAQGTALQALSRGAARLSEPSYATEAHAALGVLSAAPPLGVSLAAPGGAFYLIYSFSTAQQVLNGFIQALNGLHDEAVLGNDAQAASLFAAGDDEARSVLARYDTGAWSLYDRSTESDLSYHQLVRDFLFNLCGRTRADAQGAPAAQRAALHGQFNATNLGLRRSHAAQAPGGQSGGAPAPGGPPAPGAPGGVVPPANPADAVYCATALRFEGYEHTPPVITLAPQRVRAGRTGVLRLSLSKISAVTASVPAAAYRASLTLGHGAHTLSWRAPRRPGTYSVSVVATDLAGNTASARSSVTVTRS